jgi:hypothetical protein
VCGKKERNCKLRRHGENAFKNPGSGGADAIKTFHQKNRIPLWLKNSPTFSLYKVAIPIRLEADSLASVAGGWEWFSMPSQMGKPVESILLPRGTHTFVKPWERIASQQGNVDWFCVWLKGEEDPDAAKVEQYARWRELRKLQEENERKAAQTNENGN